MHQIASELAEIARGFYSRGWALGTSGNFSAVTSRDPLRLAITASGIDKGSVTAEQIRLFQDPSGWTPHYTDSGVSRGYEPVCLGPAYIPPHEVSR